MQQSIYQNQKNTYQRWKIHISLYKLHKKSTRTCRNIYRRLQLLEKMTKITSPDGIEHNVVEIDFDCPNEIWQEYLLEDGTKIKFRAYIESILKSDKFNEFGTPYYFVKSKTQVRTYSPPEIKGTPSKPLKIDVSTDEIKGYT